MARNEIQFQKGLSLGAFVTSYGKEAQCEAALARSRWPDGLGLALTSHRPSTRTQQI